MKKVVSCLLPASLLSAAADGEEFKASTALMFVAAASVGLLLMFYFLATLVSSELDCYNNSLRVL